MTRCVILAKKPASGWMNSQRPYYVLSDAGTKITLAFPKGVQPPLDPKSDAPDAQTDDTRRLEGDAAARVTLAMTTKLPDVDLDGNPP